MNENQHPLTETAAVEMWDASPCPEGYEFRGMLTVEQDATVYAMRAAFDAGREHERTTPADPHHDPRPWEPLAPGDPLHAGDEVWREWRGVSTRGKVDVQHPDSQVYTAERGHLGLRAVGTWYVRRIPAPTAEKETPMTETTTPTEPLARTLLAVPEGYGAPHHDADRIKAGDYVMQVDDNGVIRAGRAHHQDEDGDWQAEYGRYLTWARARADRPDALTVWPAPTLARAVLAVADLHRPIRVYDECIDTECPHEPIELGDYYGCADTFIGWACEACCYEDGDPLECEHDGVHDDLPQDQACATRAALTTKEPRP